MTTPPPPPIPKLPSRRITAILAAAMLAVGIAGGALIGPGPAVSLASNSRAAALGRVLALLALGSGTSSGSEPLLAAPPQTSAAPQPTPSVSETSAAGGSAGGGSSTATASPHTSSSPSSPSASPTPSTTPAAGGGEGEAEKTKTPLPPIASAWVIELPYGSDLENALKQSTAAPYLDGQLKREGTVLSNYSALAAAQLVGAATLLSGQVGASVATVAPPTCGGSSGTVAGQPVTAAGQPTATGQSSPADGQPTTGGEGAASPPCPSGEPAGVQAADTFLQETLPAILASASYREHGLIAIVFTGSPSTLTAGAPEGVLLLSPFLRHPGTAGTSAFNPLAPRESLAGLLTTPHH